jgi:DNA-binding NarL/FixJ family response regulator
MNKLSFLVMDDEALVRDGLCALLEKEDFVKQVVMAGDFLEFKKALSVSTFDIVLLDFRMTHGNGLELLPVLKELSNAPKVIMVTGLEGNELVINLLKAGVNSIVFKLDGYREILKAIKAVTESGSYFSDRILNIIRENAHLLGDAPPVQLTFQERELLKAIAQGLTTKEIAHELKMTESTTETYRIRLIKKMKVTNTAGLIAYAYRNGIL